MDKLIGMVQGLAFYYELNKEEANFYLSEQQQNNNNNNKNNNNNQNNRNNNNQEGSERYYLFPSLRPSEGQFRLHQIASNHPHPHYTLAVRYCNNSKSGKQFIPPYIFYQLQVITREYHASTDQIYGNGVKLHHNSTDAWIVRSTRVSEILILIILLIIIISML